MFHALRWFYELSAPHGGGLPAATSLGARPPLAAKASFWRLAMTGLHGRSRIA